jgi:PAS domain S-box-containing protein
MRWEPTWAQVLFAILVVSGATLVRLPLEPLLHGRAPYAFYYPALALVAWVCRLGPAACGTVASWFCGWYFLTPPASSPTGKSSADALAMLVFAVATSALIALTRAAARTSKSALSALQESERAHAARAQLAAIVESSDDAIVAKNLDGIVQSWNDGAQRIFGYTAAEMVGQSILRLIPHERRFEEDHILMRLRRGERVDHFETVRQTKDGRQLDISLSVSPIRNEAGEIVGASKIARDVTDRRRAERAFAEQQEWFRVTLASIGDGVITADRDGQVTYMNAVAERMTGFSLSEAKGNPLRTIFRLIHETTREPIDDPYAMVVERRALFGPANQRLLVAKDGSECPVEENVAPIVDGQNKTIGAVVGFRDVSERRRAEAAIAEQREWFETTLVSIGDAVIATDIRGHITFMNPVAEHMTGWKTVEARGRDCSVVFNIVNENTHAPVENPVARVLREGVIMGLANHTLLIARDGRQHPIDDSAAPIRGADGRISGAVLVFHDIGERRVAERERQAAEREREQLLQSERAARAEAERANRLKDQFVATVSHELRTPLNAIIGWTDVLKTTPPDAPTLARALSVIERNARIQALLVSDLLDMSRIVSGKLTLELRLVNLGEVVDAAMETVRPAADAKGVTLACNIDAGIASLVGDPARMQQIVWNLLSNAVKFTPAGGEVRVDVTRADAGVRITVVDTGAGISAEFLPYLFDRFRQADASTSRRYGGLGLGLTIVKQLVELHGGTVRAESAGEGRGATFVVELPSDSETREELQYESNGGRASLAPGGAAAIAATLNGLRVLVVEDEPDAREVVERLLSEAGCRVTAVDSVERAMKALTESRPDLLVSDIGLPAKDGYSLIQQIRESERAEIASLPAIALTAFVRTEDRNRAYRAGFQAHLAKPLDPAELIATVAGFASLVRDRRP